MAKTRLGAYGGPRQEYGTTSGKTESAGAPKGQVTRLGCYGGPRQLYGTFSGKALTVGSSVKKVRRFISNVSKMGMR